MPFERSRPPSAEEWEAAREVERLGLAADGFVGRVLFELRPLPGESDADFERRREDVAVSLRADALLLEHRLDGIYSQTTYPHGFPVDELVVPAQREFFARQTPEWKQAALAAVLDSWEPRRAVPTWAPLESGFVWGTAPVAQR